VGVRRLVAVALLVAGACTSSKPDKGAAGTSPSSRAGTTTTGPLVHSLPDGCAAAAPAAEQTVTFVKDGRAWAMDPQSGSLTCLFPVDDPGLFEWGPQAD